MKCSITHLSKEQKVALKKKESGISDIQKLFVEH